MPASPCVAGSISIFDLTLCFPLQYWLIWKQKIVCVMICGHILTKKTDFRYLHASICDQTVLFHLCTTQLLALVFLLPHIGKQSCVQAHIHNQNVMLWLSELPKLNFYLENANNWSEIVCKGWFKKTANFYCSWQQIK